MNESPSMMNQQLMHSNLLRYYRIQALEKIRVTHGLRDPHPILSETFKTGKEAISVLVELMKSSQSSKPVSLPRKNCQTKSTQTNDVSSRSLGCQTTSRQHRKKTSATQYDIAPILKHRRIQCEISLSTECIGIQTNLRPVVKSIACQYLNEATPTNQQRKRKVRSRSQTPETRTKSIDFPLENYELCFFHVRPCPRTHQARAMSYSKRRTLTNCVDSIKSGKVYLRRNLMEYTRRPRVPLEAWTSSSIPQQNVMSMPIAYDPITRRSRTCQKVRLRKVPKLF